MPRTELQRHSALTTARARLSVLRKRRDRSAFTRERIEAVQWRIRCLEGSGAAALDGLGPNTAFPDDMDLSRLLRTEADS